MSLEDLVKTYSRQIDQLNTRLRRLEAQEAARANSTPIANALVRRNVNAIMRANEYYCHVYGSGTITIPSGAWTAIPWINTRVDSNGSMWIGAYPTRIWAPLDGWIDFSAVVQLPVTTGTIGAAWRANGSTYIHEMVHAAGTLGSTLAPTLCYPCRTNDYFELMVLQNTGSNKNVTITTMVSPEARAVYRPININTAVGTQKYIMAIGDSKTVGSDGGYRILLQDIFLAANKKVGWVGAIDGVTNGTSPYGMEGYHSAQSGATISTVRSLVANATINQAPDVILVWLGTNDLRAATAEATIEAAYNGLLDDLIARWPSSTIVCANIDQNYEATIGIPPYYNPAVFNAFIAGIPAARGAHFKAVDLYTPLNYATLHNDLLHPNHPEGDWLVAQNWWLAIKTLVG